MSQRTCIFCPSVKNTPTPLHEKTRPEHIIQNKLGGRLESRELICDDCNGLFGSTIDKVLVNDFLWLRNGLEIRSGRGQAPPPMRGVESPAGTIDLGPGWKPQQARIGRIPIGDRAFRITAHNSDSGLDAVVHLLRSKGINSTEHLRGNIQLEAKATRSRLSGMSIDVEIGGPEVSRAIAKIAFEYLAYLRNDIIHDPAFNTVRDYIRLPMGTPVCATRELARLDFKTVLPTSLGLLAGFCSMLANHCRTDWPSAQQLFAKFNPELCHFIGLWTAQNGGTRSLVAEVTLFGLFRWTVELAEEWRGPLFSAVYALNPLTGVSQKKIIPFIVQLSPTWKHERSLDQEAVANRIWQAKLLCEQYQEMKAHLALRFECVREVLGITEIPYDLQVSVANEEAINKLYELRKDQFDKNFRFEQPLTEQDFIKEIEKRLNEKRK